MGVGSAGWVSWPGVWVLFNVARTVWRGPVSWLRLLAAPQCRPSVSSPRPIHKARSIYIGSDHWVGEPWSPVLLPHPRNFVRCAPPAYSFAKASTAFALNTAWRKASRAAAASAGIAGICS